jgi:hypothetical protein
MWTYDKNQTTRKCPKGILVIDDVFTNTYAIDLMYEILVSTGDRKYQFMPYDNIKESVQQDFENDLIADIVRHIWFNRAGFMISGENIKGFEVWSNSMKKDGGLHYHMDCDESNEEFTIRSPKWSCVMYLGPRDSTTVKGGDLLLDLGGFDHFSAFDAKLDRPATGEEEKRASTKMVEEDLVDNPDKWHRIPFKYNRAVIFDPGYPHAVTPVTDALENEPRVGMSICPWDKTIKIDTSKNQYEKRA